MAARSADERLGYGSQESTMRSINDVVEGSIARLALSSADVPAGEELAAGYLHVPRLSEDYFGN